MIALAKQDKNYTSESCSFKLMASIPFLHLGNKSVTFANDLWKKE
jgi:hypothetical protein